MNTASIVRHVNGIATTTPEAVALGTGAVSLLVENRGSNDLLISFDGGTKFKTVGAGLALALDVSVSTITVKSSAGSVDYEILVGVL